MRGFPSILSLFRIEFKNFIKTRARMLDSIHQMSLRLLRNHIAAVKRSKFVFMMDVITFPENMQPTSCISILLHRVY